MDFLEKLRSLKVPIEKWNKENFGIIDHKIQLLEDEMAAVNRRLEYRKEEEEEEVIARYNALQKNIHIWHERRNSYWRQLSRRKQSRIWI